VRNARSLRASRPDARKMSPDVIAFSHLRWDFVFQRPQHLMSRFAKTRRVFFFEEAVIHDSPYESKLSVRTCEKTGVMVATPHLAGQGSRYSMEETERRFLEDFCKAQAVTRPIAWYYSPELFCYSRHLDTLAVVYDCMDELANFRFASPQLPLLERDLMHRADLVFTGGYSLYEAKRKLHNRVHCFPSSVDRGHFFTARNPKNADAKDQENLPHPRLGFYGVIDERMDLGLLATVADARPDWSIILVGPVAKLTPEELPKRPNIHYLGPKTYEELPCYLAGWDVALMPFAINEATKFISPTKTPEYLAGGKPVVSTAIADVVRQYGRLQGVYIAQTPATFIDRCENALELKSDNSWLEEADAVLADSSWDRCFARMCALLDATIMKVAQEPDALAAVPYPAPAKQEQYAAQIRIEP
jgi:UDP-galactopyranose mutase